MIWNKQNEARFGTPRSDPPFLAMFATACALEYLVANYGSLSLAFLDVTLHIAAVFLICEWKAL